MSFWDGLLSNGIKGAAEGLGSLVKTVGDVITGKVTLTPEQTAELQGQLLAVDAAVQKAAADYDTMQMQGQVDLMKLDAQSGDKFRAYGRPAAIWICVAGLAYSFLLQPLLPWLVETICSVTGYVSVVKPLPALNGEVLMAMTGSLLGIGGMRSLDKIKGKC
jgi:hypothetical protein